MKHIQLNGQTRATSATTVSELLMELQLVGKPVAVECNGEVVPKRQHDAALLAEGDVIEMVTLVGGG